MELSFIKYRKLVSVKSEQIHPIPEIVKSEIGCGLLLFSKYVVFDLNKLDSRAIILNFIVLLRFPICLLLCWECHVKICFY